MSLTIYLVRLDERTGQIVEHDMLPPPVGIAGFENTRETLWGSPAVTGLGAHFLPSLRNGALLVRSSELARFRLECLHLINNLTAISAATGWAEARFAVEGGWTVGQGLRVSECARVTVTRFDDEVCARTLPPDAEVGPSAIREVLSDPAIDEALASGALLYGHDASAVDGPLFRFERDGRGASVGLQCDDGDAACEPIPPALQAVVDTMTALLEQEYAREECR